MFYESVPIQIRCRYEYSGSRLNSAGIAQEFITISKITLDMLHESSGINYESVKNMPNAARIRPELTEISDDSPRFARFLRPDQIVP